MGQVIILNWAVEQVCFIIYVRLHFLRIQLNEWLWERQKFDLSTWKIVINNPSSCFGLS